MRSAPFFYVLRAFLICLCVFVRAFAFYVRAFERGRKKVFFCFIIVAKGGARKKVEYSPVKLRNERDINESEKCKFLFYCSFYTLFAP